MNKYELELFADHFQFYIQDEGSEGINGDSWPEEASHRMLAIEKGAIGVRTVRNMGVPVTIEILDSEPKRDVADWDHVVECSIHVPSGRLVAAGCTDYFPEAMRIEVLCGTYRARVSYGSLTSLSEDGLDGDDRYRVQLWPGKTIDAEVVKFGNPNTAR